MSFDVYFLCKHGHISWHGRLTAPCQLLKCSSLFTISNSECYIGPLARAYRYTTPRNCLGDVQLLWKRVSLTKSFRARRTSVCELCQFWRVRDIAFPGGRCVASFAGEYTLQNLEVELWCMGGLTVSLGRVQACILSYRRNFSRNFVQSQPSQHPQPSLLLLGACRGLSTRFLYTSGKVTLSGLPILTMTGRHVTISDNNVMGCTKLSACLLQLHIFQTHPQLKHYSPPFHFRMHGLLYFAT